MKDLKVVAKFTIKDMVRRKSFIISNLIILLFIIVGFNVPNIMSLFSGDNENQKILIVDEKNIFEGSLEALKELDNYNITISNEKVAFDDIKDKMEESVVDNVIVLNKDDKKINMDYYVETLSMITTPPQEIVTIISELYKNLQISKLGLTNEQLESLNTEFNLEMKQTSDKEVKGDQVVMMLLSIVLFYAIYFCAYQVSNSITTEKTSKIIETLVTSTSPKIIVLGKTLGIGIVGLFQVITIILTSVISYILFLPDGMLDGLIDFSTITPLLGFMFVLYFILGYAFYALLYALTGSTVSKPEDVQSANTPIVFLVMIGFYLSYFSMIDPASSFNFVSSLLPFSSPFCMPFRIMMGLSSGVEIITSIAILVVTILIVAKVSIKIYSQAILNTGTKLSIKDIIEMYKNKNV